MNTMEELWSIASSLEMANLWSLELALGQGLGPDMLAGRPLISFLNEYPAPWDRETIMSPSSSDLSEGELR
jgi:hypothetical protein